MKKIILFFVIGLLFMISGCEKQIQVVPIERDSALFEVVYEGSQYEVMKRIDIDPSQMYYSIAYLTGDGYSVGAYERENYFVVYDGKSYHIDDGVRLKLYSGRQLMVILEIAEEKE